MADLPKSQLPTEPEYWDDLARKVGDDAAGPLAAYAAQDGWYGVLAQRAPWLVAASAAMLILWVAYRHGTPRWRFAGWSARWDRATWLER